MPKRARRYDPEDEEYYAPEVPSSTTRAVAWGALLFSVIAMLISLGTLFLTWHNGELVKNATMLSQALSQHWKRAPTAHAAPGTGASAAAPLAGGGTAAESGTAQPGGGAGDADAGPIASNATEADKLQSIRARLDQLAAKINLGQADAPARLEQLRREMEGLSHFASDSAGKWLTPALAKLRSARDQLQQNGPQAASVLKTMANDLRNRLATINFGPNAAATATATPEELTTLPDAGAAPESAPLDRPALAEDTSGASGH